MTKPQKFTQISRKEHADKSPNDLRFLADEAQVKGHPQTAKELRALAEEKLDQLFRSADFMRYGFKSESEYQEWQLHMKKAA